MNREGQQGTEYHLDALYQRVVMLHAADPAGTTSLSKESVRTEGYNPVCGDEITVSLRAKAGATESEILEGVQILVVGCSICRASGSILWNLIQNQPILEIHNAIEHFRHVLDGAVPDEAIVGEASALRGVARFPIRIDCAWLPWSTLREALEKLSHQEAS